VEEYLNDLFFCNFGKKLFIFGVELLVTQQTGLYELIEEVNNKGY
jgi:hypothetical protein